MGVLSVWEVICISGRIWRVACGSRLVAKSGSKLFSQACHQILPIQLLHSAVHMKRKRERDIERNKMELKRKFWLEKDLRKANSQNLRKRSKIGNVEMNST